MKSFRLSLLIPLLLILSAVASSGLLFWQQIGVANSGIRQAAVDDLNIALTQLQNMLNTQLAADSLEDAKLSLSVSASHPGIRTLLLADENNRVMLANRYLWEGSPAPQVCGYVEAIARQVRQTQASSVSSNASLLSGYYPVTLRIAVGGMGRDRVGVIFVEYELAPQLAQARHNAVVQASLFGGLTIAVAIAVAILLHWLVSRRVKKLVEASQRFAAGDMDARVHLRGHDELAELGHAFDDMASQRKEAQDKVVQLSLRNRLILDSMGEGIYGLDTDGRCTFVNPAALELIGFSVEELLGQHCHPLFHHSKPDGSPYPVEECPVQAVYTQGAAHRGSDLYWRKDGSSFPVEFISAPILEAGQIVGAVVAFRDITARKQAEAAVRQLNAELEQRVLQRTAQLEEMNKELEEFSYSMSHDMRTPLRALDGFSKILLEEHDAGLDAEGKRLLKVLSDNAQRMGRMIDDILRYLSIGRQRMAAGPLDMVQLTAESFTSLQVANPARKLRLQSGPLPPAWGDREMIVEVLRNILSNAVKFSPADGEVLIEVGGTAENDENVYSVRDHGIGFDMRFVDKLFRVFERVHPTGQYEGSGIGLAIVKRIVTRHGGRVWAQGKVNQGATIYFALPNRQKEHG